MVQLILRRRFLGNIRLEMFNVFFDTLKQERGERDCRLRGGKGKPTQVLKTSFQSTLAERGRVSVEGFKASGHIKVIVYCRFSIMITPLGGTHFPMHMLYWSYVL